MPDRLVPATLAFAPGGTPYSAAFDDVYHSSEGGPAQARHVFLGGNDLPARWRGRSRFAILETGFGLGVNFLATWTAWREDPSRPAKLHFVSIEKHPFAREDLARLHERYPELEGLARELRGKWPMLVPGVHRIEFEGGCVVLTLWFGDAASALPQLPMAADAFFLDGFSPAKNPDMWAAPLVRTLATRAGTGATFATYTAAGAVRAALEAAGFHVEKKPGFARKRDMLCGRFMRPLPGTAPPDRRAIVVGAGLAGSAVCERLSARGWEVVLFERHPQPAQGASGNHAGAFHPLVTRDDSLMARLSRASFLHALHQWPALQDVEWSTCGVLQMARSIEEDAAQRLALEELGYPPGYAAYLDAAQAARVTGMEIAAGGIWFPQGGWMRPSTLVRALLAKARPDLRCSVEVDSIERSISGWVARDTSGRALAEAPVVVLANAQDAARLAPIAEVELRVVRGQVTYLPADRAPGVRSVLLRGGMLTPAIDGIAVAGASYDVGDDDPNAREDSHAGNLERLARILPGAAPFEPGSLRGRVGFRSVAPDRLPLVGPIDDRPALHAAFGYASRGILWCSLMAELLVSRLEDEPLPVELRLAEAVAPGRFAQRARRRAGSTGSRP